VETTTAAARRAVLVAATVAAFLTPFMGSTINVALPTIGRELQMDAVLLGWVNTAYLIAAAMFLVPFGRIADIYGRKKVFAYGTLFFTISSLLAALSSSSAMLISLRVLQGISGAMIFGTSVAILTSVFPPGDRGRVLGINVAAVYVGLSVGPFVGGLLTEHFGWRSVFYANVPLGLIVLALVLWKLKGEWAMARGEKFDLTGSVVYGIMLLAIMYGLSLLPQMLGVWLIVVGVVALVAFVWWEIRAKSPVLNMNLFRNSAAFTFSNLAALINYAATFAVSFLLSFYLQYIKGFTPETAGLILISAPVVQAVVSPAAGRLSDRVQPRILASVGMALAVVPLAVFAFLGYRTPLALVIGALCLLGFGFALFSSPNTNAVMSSVENRFYGVAAATLATMRQVGMTFSMGIAMMLFAVYIGRVQITPEYYDAFLRSESVAFIVFACLCFAGIFASLARGRVR
jgi:EmrB/QacA subfamily drug resistance transporter